MTAGLRQDAFARHGGPEFPRYNTMTTETNRLDGAALRRTSMTVLHRDFALFSFLAFSIVWQAVSVSAADFYVAPHGKDSNPGTAAAPFATVTRARDAVRQQVRAGLTKDILVVIRGGVYPQTRTLTFGPEDSGTEQHSITYRAYSRENVVLSGGRRITGWKKGTGKIWITQIPEIQADKWYFRQLFINGNRAIRARTPNADSAEPWCKMVSSTAKAEEEDKPIAVRLGGYKQPFQIKAYNNPGDVELVYLCNNDMGRKRLGTVDEKDQTFTLAPPHRWNSKTHEFDWYLSFPDPRWKACYLENALEMLDQPGEWYLDRSSGVLSYWPRPGEDMVKAEVVAPVVQKTLLAVIGTREQPVRNLIFSGIRVEHLEWAPPEWGYMGLFCCTIDTGPKDRLEHGFLDAAVEFEHARSCHFIDGGIAHVGGMGLCLRRGTADNIIEGNEISDIGAGGIGVSEIRQNPIGQRPWNPLPQPDDYKGYRIANNHIHHCGTDFYGAVGIALMMTQNSVVAHNLIHDTAYSGMQWAGDCPGQPAFTRNNTVEFNHIYDTMQVTSDGAGMYVTYGHGGQTVIRGNLIHDTRCNPFRRGESELFKSDIPCHGLYLDGQMNGGRYENNVVFRNAGGPLLFNSHQNKNVWQDNLFLKDGALPAEFVEVMQACAGLEPSYQKSILKQDANPCQFSVLSDPATAKGWTAYQFHLPAKNRGIVQIVRREGCTAETVTLKPRGLKAKVRYDLKGYVGSLAPADGTFYAGTLIDEGTKKNYLTALGDLPILSGYAGLPLVELGLPVVDGRTRMTGKDLLETGLVLTLGKSSQVVWIAYRATK